MSKAPGQPSSFSSLAGATVLLALGLPGLGAAAFFGAWMVSLVRCVVASSR